MHARTPIVLSVVAGLGFLVLMFSFRSVVLPLVSIGLNLLSVGAAYGLVTLIFQDGHLQGLLGFTSFGAIIPWVPLFMFVFLFEMCIRDRGQRDLRRQEDLTRTRDPAQQDLAQQRDLGPPGDLARQRGPAPAAGGRTPGCGGWGATAGGIPVSKSWRWAVRWWPPSSRRPSR